MKKAELIDAVASKCGVTKKDAEAVLAAAFEEVANVAKKKDSVTIPGFGTFKGVKVAARECRNPATGKKIKVPAHTKMAFSMSKALKEKLA